jgi:hypothetical protein
LALGIPLAEYLLVYRPQQLRWGATDEELARAMPIWKGNNYKVMAVEPNHYLVWASPDGGWSMVVALYPVDADHTRLVWRQHAAYNWMTPSVLIPELFSDATDLIAIRQNMLGIKARAEGQGLHLRSSSTPSWPYG